MKKYTVIRVVNVHAESLEEAAEIGNSEIKEDEPTAVYVTQDLAFEDKIAETAGMTTMNLNDEGDVEEEDDVDLDEEIDELDKVED